MQAQRWIFSKWIDLLVLGLPVWASWAVCFTLPEEALTQKLPLWVWVVFILGVDVSHVWSTIFRTYLDKEEFANHRRVLLVTPPVVFALLFLITLYSIQWFWTVMAYLALHHFIKQQYGFLAIYRAKFGYYPIKIFKDKWVIYFSMLYPVIYWHLTSQRRYNWFVNGDFFNFYTYFQPLEFILPYTNYAYGLVLLAWLLEELYIHQKTQHRLPYGKILWLLTTAGNWYLGIVYFNSDIAFSLTNVIAHGVPYMALIFVYVERKKALHRPAVSYFTISLHVIGMLLTVLLLAFGEEYFWDLLLNREKQAFFSYFLSYPIAAFQSVWGQAFAAALLSIPQVSHYIIDGYIWKGGKKNPYLKKVLF